MIVIDASIALASALQEREHADVSAALDYVGEHGAYVPGGFQSEVANGLLQAERRKRLTETEITEALGNILALPLTVELPDPHVVISLARAHGLTCYDASYLAIALQLRVPLATLDDHLRRAALATKSSWRAKKGAG